MGISRRARLWTGVSTAVLLGAGCSPSDQPPAKEQAETAAAQPSAEAQSPTASEPKAESALPPIEAGEGGESGMGGERGIDAQAAAKDPVLYLVALEVIRAHFLAGEAAYDIGKTEAAAEMFAHPISEVYVDLEPVFAAQGVEAFDTLMMQAVDLASTGAPAKDVTAAVQAVIAAVDAAGGKAPESTASPAHVAGAVIADLAERTALQYQHVRSGGPGEAWLDGYGYLHALEGRADKDLAVIEAADKDAAAAVHQGLAVLRQTFPEITPAETGPETGVVLAASSSIGFAVASL